MAAIRPVALSLALGAASACAAPPAPAPVAPAAAPAEGKCSLIVRFGSYATGIDRAAAAAVEKLIGGDRAVTATRREGAGREGEYGICATTRTGADAARLFAEIRDILPLRPHGPIHVEAGALRYSVPRR